MAGKPHFIAGIKGTRLRRASMVIVVPFLLRGLIPAAFATLALAVLEAADAFGSVIRDELQSRNMRALKLGLSRMWSADWNPEP